MEAIKLKSNRKNENNVLFIWRQCDIFTISLEGLY